MKNNKWNYDKMKLLKKYAIQCGHCLRNTLLPYQ